MKKTAKEILTELGNFFIKENIGRISIDEHIFNYDKFEETFTGTHQMGGTCAGENYKNSVVDKNLKVHFIKNYHHFVFNIWKSEANSWIFPPKLSPRHVFHRSFRKHRTHILLYGALVPNDAGIPRLLSCMTHVVAVVSNGS